MVLAGEFVSLVVKLVVDHCDIGFEYRGGKFLKSSLLLLSGGVKGEKESGGEPNGGAGDAIGVALGSGGGGGGGGEGGSGGSSGSSGGSGGGRVRRGTRRGGRGKTLGVNKNWQKVKTGIKKLSKAEVAERKTRVEVFSM